MKYRPSIRSLLLPPPLQFIPCFAAACFLVATASAQPYGLQYGAQRDLAAAEQLKAQLEQQNLGPVTILSDAEWHRVFVGRYRVFVDAQLAKDDVRKRTGRDVFIRAIPNAPDSAYTDPTATIAPFFNSLTGERVTAAPESLKGNAAYERLEALDTPGNKEAYAVALRAELPSLSNNNPLKGYILTNLGITEIIAERYDAALELLRPVADGDVAAAKAHRVMAMRRVAWITHWHKLDRFAAYRAYRELEKFSGSESVKTLCKVECAGLLMELAESGKGTHEEVRAEIERDLSEIGEDAIQPRATLELMYSETYSRQPNKDKRRAAELSEQLYERLKALGDKAPEREMVAALRQGAMYRFQCGDKDRALSMYSELFERFPDGEEVDSFRGHNQHVLAAYDLGKMAATEGELLEFYKLKKELIRLYPDEALSKMLLKKYPHLVREMEADRRMEGGKQ